MKCLKCGIDLPEEAYFCSECGAKIRDKITDKIFLPTPHGGVMSEISYFDEEHNPCAKDKAWFMEVAEYNDEGDRVYYFTAKRRRRSQ